LFMSFVVNAKNYIICKGSYDEAVLKIESLPVIHGINESSQYICLDGKTVEIKW